MVPRVANNTYCCFDKGVALTRGDAKSVHMAWHNTGCMQHPVLMDFIASIVFEECDMGEQAWRCTSHIRCKVFLKLHSEIMVTVGDSLGPDNRGKAAGDTNCRHCITLPGRCTATTFRQESYPQAEPPEWTGSIACSAVPSWPPALLRLRAGQHQKESATSKEDRQSQAKLLS